MSGFAFYARWDGASVQPDLAEELVLELAHRGRDAAALWKRGAVCGAALKHRVTARQSHDLALAHRGLIARDSSPSTPSEVFERVDRPAGLRVLMADCRLDERAASASALGLDPMWAREGSDEEFLLAAFEACGPACLEHLEGDFAFALWDEERGEVFCARDHFGVRPLYFHDAPGSHFACASEMKALWRCPGVPRRESESRIASHLANVFDERSTFFEELHSLAPGHYLVAGPDGARLERYFALDPTREIKLANDGEYIEAFLELFERAVANRMGDIERPAAFLSGGLDSSAICVMARAINRRAEKKEETLIAFSTVYDDNPELDEREWMQMVLREGGFEWHKLIGETCSSLFDIERLLWHQDEPISAPNLASSWRQYEALNGLGVPAVLDGHGGDEVLCSEWGLLNEMVAGGDWRGLWHELKSLETNGIIDVPARALMSQYVTARARGTLPGRVVARLGRVLGRKREPGAGAQEPDWIPLDIMHPELTREHDLTRRWHRQANTPRLPTLRAQHLRTLEGPLQTIAFENLNKSTAAYAVEPRYPLWDRRLAEFCLALPARQKTRDGWTRSILRRSTKDLLPEGIRWRNNKANFLPDFVRGLRIDGPSRFEPLLANPGHAIFEFARHDETQRIWRAVQDEQPTDGHEVMSLWRVITTALWLDRPTQPRMPARFTHRFE